MYNDYGFGSTPSIDSLTSGVTAAAIVGVIIGVLIGLAVMILIVISNCKLFTKAGEKWWKAIVPFYNSWIETKIVGLAWWWFPIFVGVTALMGMGENLNYVFTWLLVLTSFNYNYNLAKKFGKSNGFALLNTILPVVGLPILAFGSAKYNKDAEVDENGIFSIKKESN